MTVACNERMNREQIDTCSFDDEKINSCFSTSDFVEVNLFQSTALVS